MTHAIGDGKPTAAYAGSIFLSPSILIAIIAATPVDDSVLIPLVRQHESPITGNWQLPPARSTISTHLCYRLLFSKLLFISAAAQRPGAAYLSVSSAGLLKPSSKDVPASIMACLSG